MWTPTTEEWGFLTASVSTLGGLVATAVGAYRKFDKRTTTLEANTATLQPNGGASLADAVRRIEKAVEKLDTKQDSQCELLSNLTGRFEQHITETAKNNRGTELWRTDQERSHRR